MQKSCIICKELVDKRYSVHVKDTKIDNSLEAHICRHCFNKFVSSHNNEGLFGITKFIGWLKTSRYRM